MIRNKLLIGISLAALAAGGAHAQNNTTDINCEGEDNTCIVDNGDTENDDNSATIDVEGDDNTAVTRQRGDDNVSIIEIDGDDNLVVHDQEGDEHFASTDINGDNNVSYIIQDDEENSATVIQRGGEDDDGDDAGNVSVVAQGENFNSEFESEGFVGENNFARVTQDGSDLVSVVFQGSDEFDGDSADDNSATVLQLGDGSVSYIVQESRGNFATVRIDGGGDEEDEENLSYITQDNDFFSDDDGEAVEDSDGPQVGSNPESDNFADVSIIGVQNESRIDQNGVNNSATVSMLGGGSGNTGETASNDESNRGENDEVLPANRMEGNSSDLTQAGSGNTYEISLGFNPNGGTAAQGNIATVTQGQADSGEGEELGDGHTAFVFQQGTLDTVQITQTNNEVEVGEEETEVEQDGSFADVATLSFNSSVTVTQAGTNTADISVALNADNSGGGNTIEVNQTDAGEEVSQSGGDPDGVFGGGSGPTEEINEARNFVGISQSGIGNDIDIDQNAVQASASVFQRRGTEDLTVNISQGMGEANSAIGIIDDPDTPLDESAAGTGQDGSSMIADVEQSGFGHTATVNQDGDDLVATITQSGGEDDDAVDENGIADEGAEDDQGNIATISQINSDNSATVTQDGEDNTANVQQQGAQAEETRPNLVTIDQTGDGNTAIARQTENVGDTDADETENAGSALPAGQDDLPNARREGEAASAEIVIMQDGSDNMAEIEQRGRGQFARITQIGSDNNGAILQEEGATNAVAILEQEGDDNTFFITQTEAGQYIFVRQEGDENESTTTVESSDTDEDGNVNGGDTSTTVNPFEMPMLPPAL